MTRYQAHPNETPRLSFFLDQYPHKLHKHITQAQEQTWIQIKLKTNARTFYFMCPMGYM